MVTSRDFAGTTWRLVRENGAVVAPVVMLRPDGGIGGVEEAIARGWRVRDDRLAILDGDGVASLTFALPRNGDARRLAGCVAGAETTVVGLERIALPSALAAPQPPAPAPVFRDRVGRRRDDLVILRAGTGSLHPTWTDDLDDADRDWDLCISWYDAAEPDPEMPCEYLTVQREVRKLAAVRDIFAHRPDFADYRRIWLPDDDLAVSRRAINRLFAICRRNHLDLAQPALDEASHVSHAVTRRDPRFALRFTNFVEVMCPVFSAEALTACLDTFPTTLTSWGLDVVWPSLVGAGGTRIAIVDAVTVTHTRPVGGGYDMSSAFGEMNALLAAWGKKLAPVVYGGISAGAPV
ncbi:MAG: DUF707 domain-containing protein [Phyllobacteriaceae bacterium]|nr:DUF707 domain-containing protein [Phyllobacteriaceae bacterium]